MRILGLITGIEFEPFRYKANYCIELFDQRRKLPVYAYPTRSGVVVLSLEVINREGKAWQADIYGAGQETYKIYYTPNPDIFCVVIGEEGYWIDTMKPEQFHRIEAHPVVNIVPWPAKKYFSLWITTISLHTTGKVCYGL